MKLSSIQVQKLLSDNQPRQFSQLGFGLLVTRLKSEFKKDSSSSKLQAYTDEINQFLTKFERIMTSDFQVLARL